MQTLPVHMAPATAFEALAPRRRVLLIGDGATELASYITAQRACQKMPVRLVCGDNRFNPYVISTFAKAIGIRPAEALSAILIARAFTAYQLIELVNRLETHANDFVIITGICAMFCDEDLSNNDAARLFYRVYWKLGELTRRGMSLLLVESKALPVERRNYFLKDLCQTSEVVLSLSNQPTFTLDQRFNRAKLEPDAKKHLAGN
jgi:hypothetical protein